MSLVNSDDERIQGTAAEDYPVMRQDPVDVKLLALSEIVYDSTK